MQMIETRRIIVRDRQDGLLAEAEAERLARVVREDAARNDGLGRPEDDGAARNQARSIRSDGYAGRRGVISISVGATAAAVLTAARVDVGRRLIELGSALAAEPTLVPDSDCSEA